ncbi:MAG: hypothetical protein WC372_01235 [Candidatus Neomarinimicrobiota bacterium]|jgi:hypothetical protein|nr:hypothetical protein [Candidatus Neomarinimicrobiota bacterium]MDD3965657.1 hypothetical protein [Candidatus Neomarinimicrobiota bacterium]MDX9780744.1 hypothetical protein [bacterium]
MLKRITALLSLCVVFLFALPHAVTYQLSDTLVYEGLGSNAVTDILNVNDSTLLFATGNGLSITYDRAESIVTFYANGNSISYGAVTGMAVLGEHIWIATAYDTAVLEGSYYYDYPKGNGISYSPDGGRSWQRFPQSVDSPDDNYEILYGDSIPALPITSSINNLIYDLAVQLTGTGDTVLWSTNFAGGCRRSYDKGASWQRVILPPDRYDVLNEDTPRDFHLSPTSGALGYESNLNHRAFSVHAAGDTILVGTANGINISYDSGYSWEKFTAQNSGISGNFVVDLTMNTNGQIYAVTLPTKETEQQGIALSQRNTNAMLYWESYLNGHRIYQIRPGSDGSIYAGGETGLWFSADGWNWLRMPQIRDENGQYLLTEVVYSILEDESASLWVGTADGLVRSDDGGYSWKIFRRVNTGFSELPGLSAYPNPFSPSHMNRMGGEGYVRIHCELSASARISIAIYDFAMQRVKALVEDVPAESGVTEFVWNGRNGLNNLVANGVYFIRMTTDSGGTFQTQWTKLIVLD